jgi:hypothetical protein
VLPLNSFGLLFVTALDGDWFDVIPDDSAVI